MKKKSLTIASIILLIVVACACYYVYLPAVNIHSADCWFFAGTVLVVAMLVYLLRVLGKNMFVVSQKGIHPNLRMIDLKTMRPLKFMLVLLGLLIAAYFIGSILSSPIINAGKYQALLEVQERVFTDDIKEVDFNTIPLLDKNSASILGNRKMGSLVDMVSQFEVSEDYTQINYKGRPVRVTPLVYASPVKWFTNFSHGIPAYILIDMATQNTECVKLTEGIKYSKSEFFNRNLYRHLRFNYPTYIFADQLFFEIDEEGTPYWVCPVKKFNIGLFGGQTVGRCVLVNAITGECMDYDVAEVPQWVDKVYAAELLTGLYDYHGILKNGFFNSVLGQRDCLKTTNGYNYIALDDDVWVYSGITSVSGDQSNVGFVLMNQRTMETRYYKVEGAIEDSAMSSAEGQVQNLGYRATFPLLLNIADEPTYFMALKDAAGLVKKYAMVNVQKYQWVAIGDTIKECERNYTELLDTNGIVSENVNARRTVTGVVEAISPVVIEGNTHFYLCLTGNDDLFDVDMTDDRLIGIIRYKEGDHITLEYSEGYGLNSVKEIKK